MRFQKLIAISVVLLACLTGCGGATQNSGSGSGDYPVTVQNCGREVTIEQRPERVYVIGGEAGTIVHAAGGIDQVSTFTQLKGEPLGAAQDALLGVEKQAPITTASDLSREAIIGEDPDLVITFGLNDFTPEDLQAVDIPVLILAGYCGGFGAGQSEVGDPLQGVYDDVRMVGNALGTSKVADPAAQRLQQRADAVRQEGRKNPPSDSGTLALFVIDARTALGAYGRRSMIHQQMDYAGLKNLLGSTNERYFEPNTEAIIGAAPQRILALYEPGDTPRQAVAAGVTDRDELSQVPAVAKRLILPLNFYYSGHGTLAVDGLEQLAEQLKTQ